MISLSIHDKAGQEVGTYELELDDLVSSVNKQLLHDAVVMYEANRRVGTVRTKSRGKVAGSTQKLYRQKGTGRARMGPKRTPVRRGGGHTFAKVPKDWDYRLPKKALRLASRMALRSKFEDDQVTLLDSLEIEEPKTRLMAGVLKALGVDKTTCLLVISEYDSLIWRSARNIPGLWVSPAAELNAYRLLHQKQLLITKDALDNLREQNRPITAATASE